jgi:hypothetical protein
MTKPELPDTPASTGRVCVDFDGTLAEGVWPSSNIGKPIGKGIAILIHYANQGREVIVYTARPESHKERIFAWLRLAGLQDHVYDVVCGKPVSDLYIDDKSWDPWHVCKEEGDVAAASGASGLGPTLSKADSPSPFKKTRDDIYTNMGAVNG